MDSVVQSLLPPASDLSPSVRSFLNNKLRSNEHLSQAPTLLSELQAQCGDLDQALIDLNRSLGSSLLAYASVSDRAHGFLGDINSQLTRLESSTRSRSSGSFAMPLFSFQVFKFLGSNSLTFLLFWADEQGKERVEQILGEELPALAKEVARVESVRSYAGKL